MEPRKRGHWLEVETVGDVVVGRFVHCRILSEDAVQQAGEQLLDLVESGSAPKVVLDLGGVEGMSTSFLGKLTALRTRVVDAGGRLALCQVNPVVQEILTICRFDRLAPSYGTEHEALESF